MPSVFIHISRQTSNVYRAIHGGRKEKKEEKNVKREGDVMYRADSRGPAGADLMPCNSIDANSLPRWDRMQEGGMSKPAVFSSIGRRDAPRIIGKGYKNPIAHSRNFEDASWWRSACHKPDLPSGFVKFMGIDETVYGKSKGKTATAVYEEGGISTRGNTRGRGSQGRSEEARRGREDRRILEKCRGSGNRTRIV